MHPDELHRLPPEEFTAARDACAKALKAAGDPTAATAVRALRRPSVSAWLVNVLARTEPGLLEQLLALGPALAQAQAAGSGDELRRLGAERRELVGAVAARAVELAGRPVTAAVSEEVQATLETALADPASATAVRSGRLVRALSYAGFGGVDLDGAVAMTAEEAVPTAPAAASSRASGTTTTKRPRTGPTPQPAKSESTKGDHRAPDEDEARAAAEQSAAEQQRAAQRAHAALVAAAEAAALAACGDLDDAVQQCRQAQAALEQAEVAAADAAGELDRLRAALADAERAAADAQALRAEAATRAEAAVRRVEQQQEAADAARAELDRLRRA